MFRPQLKLGPFPYKTHNKRVNADRPRRWVAALKFSISTVHFIKFQRWSACRLRAGPLGNLNKIRSTHMKLKSLLILGLALFFFQSISMAQGQEQEIDVEATSWQFSKMAYATKLLFTQAYENKNSELYGSARQHLKYAENNLKKLEGKIDSTRFEEAQTISDVLDTALAKGLNIDMGDQLALSIAERKIDEFVKTIFVTEDSN